MKNQSKQQLASASQKARGRRSISHHLWTLVVLSIFPLLCFLAYTVIATSRAEAERAERQAEHLAQSIADVFDVEWAKLEASLLVLADSPALQKGDLPAFDREAREFNRHNGAHVVLIDTGGQQLLRAPSAAGTRLGKTPNQAAVDTVLRTGKPVIVDAFASSFDQSQRVALYVPVIVAGQAKFVLSASWTLHSLGGQVSGAIVPAGWLAALIDGRGTRLWRNVRPELVGTVVSPGLRESLQAPARQRSTFTAADGLEVVSFHHPLAKANWTVAVGVPKAELDAPFHRSLLSLSAAGALALVLSLLLAARISRKLETAVAAVETQAARLGQGVDPDPLEVGIVELQRLSDAIRAAQAALRENKQRLTLALRVSDTGVWELALPSRAVSVDAAWLALLGYAADEVQSAAGWMDLLHPEDREDAVRTFGALIAGELGVWRCELRVRSKSGAWRWLLSQAVVAERDDDGRAMRIVGTHTAIDDRKRVEEDLRQREAHLRLAMDVAKIGTWERDLETGVGMWSAQTKAILGLSEDSYTFEDFVRRIHPDDRQRMRAVLATPAGGEPFEHEYRIVRADGEVRWVNERGQAIQDAPGKPVRVLGAAVDVTERRLIDDRLRAAKAEAERANNGKSRFLAAASHDLRQPLSALSLYVGVLGKKLPPADEPLLKSIRDCVASLSEMLGDLLDLSKLEAGVVKLEPADFALAKVLANVVSVHAPEAQAKGLSLRCAPSDLIARTDPVLFGRILANLVANAIRYTEQGGVLIGCRRSRGKLWVEVWDTGIGIPADKTAEIFEEFKQLDNEARNRSKGSGLGLAIVAKAANLLGLEIRVRSRLGKGSLFAVEVPPGRAPAPAAAPERHAFRPLRVALVEDDALVAGALGYVLAQAGHQAIVAASGRELLARLDGRTPDALISDYRLADGETGFDIITLLQSTFGPRLPALIITGDTDPQLLRDMSRHGIRVQHKPIAADTLLSCLMELTGEPDRCDRPPPMNPSDD